jgi:hypothetical protein
VSEGETRAGRFAGTALDRLPVRGALAAVAAVAGNVALLVAANAIGVAPGFRPLAVPPVAFLSVAGVVGATVVYWFLRRRSSKPARTFRRVAGGVLVVSFLPDVALLFVDEAATVAGVVVLMAMHVVVAAACVALLPGEPR